MLPSSKKPTGHVEFLAQFRSAGRLSKEHSPIHNTPDVFNGLLPLRKAGCSRVADKPISMWVRGEERPDTSPRGYDSSDFATKGGSSGSADSMVEYYRIPSLATINSNRRMEIPSQADWGSLYECDYGGEEKCGLPLLNEGTMDDLASINIGAEGESVIITGTTDRDQEELLLTAWAILQANTDLIEWLICWTSVEGSAVQNADFEWLEKLFEWLGRLGFEKADWDNADASCIKSLLDGKSPVTGLTNRTELRVIYGDFVDTSIEGRIIKLFIGEDDLDYSYYCANASAWFYPLNYIYICGESDLWETSVDAWSCGDPVDKYCAAVTLASTILHELTHLCLFSPIDVPQNCEVSYLVGSTFKWLMFERYPDLKTSSCCAVFDDSTFMAHASMNIPDNCITCSTSTTITIPSKEFYGQTLLRERSLDVSILASAALLQSAA